MKKIILGLLILSAPVIAQDRYRLGIGFGSVNNHSRFVSGNEEAHALFNQQDLTSGHIAFTLHRELGNRFSMQASFAFTEVGFSYSLSKNYSLLDPESRYLTSRSANCIGSVPFFFNIQSNLNCRNWHWVGGIGPELIYSGGSYSESRGTDKDPNDITSSEIIQHTEFAPFSALNLNWHISREKLLKKGGLFRFGFLASHGFSEIGYSEVQYTIDNRTYLHNFTNNGSYAGIYLAWMFRPLKQKS